MKRMLTQKQRRTNLYRSIIDYFDPVDYESEALEDAFYYVLKLGYLSCDTLEDLEDDEFIKMVDELDL